MQSIIKTLLIFLSTNILLLQLCHADSIDNKDCKLTLGWGSWPPYQSAIEPTQPFGIQIDLIKQIADAASCSLKFKKNSFEKNLEAVKKGEVDFMMDASITEERKVYGYFSAPYRQEVLALYLKPQYVEKCANATFESLIESGIRIGMNKGNIYGEEVTRAQSKKALDSQLIYAPNNDALYKLFEENKIDGFFDDPTVIAYNLRIANRSGELSLCKVSQTSSPVSLLFSKKTTNLEIVERIDKALEKVKETEEYKSNWGW